jgi:hypothetical protein
MTKEAALALIDAHKNKLIHPVDRRAAKKVLHG